MSATYPPSGVEPYALGAEGTGPPRWLAAVAGVLSIVVGIAALVWPGPTLLAVGILFGCYFLVWAVGLLIRAIGSHDVSAGLRVLDAMVGVLALLVGLTLVVRPGASVATAALALGFWWVLLGAMQFVHGVIDPVGRAWNIIWGVVGAIAGVIILASPEIALGTLVLIVGIGLILQGALELLVAFAGGGR